MKIVDVAFITLVVTIVLWILWELIPGHAKKYWSYIWQTRKDHKAGWYNRKWIWSFRNGIGREKK